MFDGHGGYQISQFLSGAVGEYFQDNYNPADGVESAKNAILHAYRRAEANLWQWCEPVARIGFSGVVKVGSCGVSAVLLKEGDGRAHTVVVGVLSVLGRKGVGSGGVGGDWRLMCCMKSNITQMFPHQPHLGGRKWLGVADVGTFE